MDLGRRVSAAMKWGGNGAGTLGATDRSIKRGLGRRPLSRLLLPLARLCCSWPMAASWTRLDALVVLGCKVTSDGPSPALLRRLSHAQFIQEEWAVPVVIMSGGKSWQGTREAVAMEQWWKRTGSRVACELVLEQTSCTTRENASCVSVLLRERQLTRVGLVTCDYHMSRATWLFRSQRVNVVRFPAAAKRSRLEKARLALREGAALLLNVCQGSPS